MSNNKTFTINDYFKKHCLELALKYGGEKLYDKIEKQPREKFTRKYTLEEMKEMK